MRLKPNDGNAATHLIRSALGERGFQREGNIWLIKFRWDRLWSWPWEAFSNADNPSGLLKWHLELKTLIESAFPGYGSHVQRWHHNYSRILRRWVSPILLNWFLHKDSSGDAQGSHCSNFELTQNWLIFILFISPRKGFGKLTCDWISDPLKI